MWIGAPDRAARSSFGPTSRRSPPGPLQQRRAMQWSVSWLERTPPVRRRSTRSPHRDQGRHRRAGTRQVHDVRCRRQGPRPDRRSIDGSRPRGPPRGPQQVRRASCSTPPARAPKPSVDAHCTPASRPRRGPSVARHVPRRADGPDPIGADLGFAIHSLAISLDLQVSSFVRLLGDACSRRCWPCGSAT